MLKNLISELENLADEEKSKNYAKFFKTAKGEYGEGDKFYGISVPDQYKIVKKYFKEIYISDIVKLLNSEYHEQRLTGIKIMVEKYKKGNDDVKKEMFDFYMKNTSRINNWDLVDSSAPYIVGNYLLDGDKKILYTLVESENLWERRISIIATLYFIKYNSFEDTLKLCKILINDNHDLIHKATGRCLREVGKKDEKVLTDFLDKNVTFMPRTMLRYAIEKFDEEKRKYYLNKK